MIKRPETLKQYQQRMEELWEIVSRYYADTVRQQGLHPSDDLMNIVAYTAALSACDLRQLKWRFL